MKLLDKQQIKILLHDSSLFTLRSRDKTNAVASFMEMVFTRKALHAWINQ